MPFIPFPEARMSTRWPQGAKAAISLTYDDGRITQVQNAVPLLDKHNLKGTFFIQGITSDSLPASKEFWKDASRRGHELAGHSMYHPCAKVKTWVKKGFALEDYTMERMAKELDDSIAFLKDITGTQGPFTNAYPCGQTYVGEDRQSYIPLVAERFFAARSTVNAIAMPGTFSYAEIPTIPGENLTGKQLIEKAKESAERGGWGIFMFHDVGADDLSVDTAAYEELLAYLDKNRSTYWTDTFMNVAKFLKAS
jgi:peptidoglycan/xylan/chitin deacetylase (PgdA/CDA1 family)